MIVVDTSVWIPFLHGHVTAAVDRLNRLPHLRHVIVGDLVLMEILSGARSEGIASNIRDDFERFELRAMGGFDIAIRAAGYYRTLRSLGITIRSSVDVFIATYCIEAGHELLHQDRDFDHFERHLGLKVLH